MGCCVRAATGRRKACPRARHHGGRRPAVLDGRVRDQESDDKAASNVMVDAVQPAGAKLAAVAGRYRLDAWFDLGKMAGSIRVR